MRSSELGTWRAVDGAASSVFMEASTATDFSFQTRILTNLARWNKDRALSDTGRYMLSARGTATPQTAFREYWCKCAAISCERVSRTASDARSASPPIQPLVSDENANSSLQHRADVCSSHFLQARKACPHVTLLPTQTTHTESSRRDHAIAKMPPSLIRASLISDEAITCCRRKPACNMVLGYESIMLAGSVTTTCAQSRCHSDVSPARTRCHKELRCCREPCQMHREQSRG